MSGTARTSQLGRDEGFSLVEAVMASFIVVLLFAGFGKSMSVAFSGSHDNAVAQEATALAVEQLEFVRSLAWDEIGMSFVPQSAPLIDATSGIILAAEANLDEDEPLYVREDGLVYPEATETVDGTAYTVRRYVSTTSSGLRRVVVLVTWEVDGVVSSYRASTMISEVSTR